jgi:DNA-binding response OmpR family regulator
MLEGEGFDVIEAAGGIDGLAQAVSSVPDLVIVDLMMPDVDGEQLIAQMMETDGVNGVPILVVTAKYSALNRCEALLGEENVFSKPFQATRLLDRVGELIGFPDEDQS